MGYGLEAQVIKYNDISDSDRGEIFRIRKKAFIDRRGWEIATYSGGDEECDQYDDMNSSYLVVRYEGSISGCVRVRPSCMPNFIDQNFGWLRSECLAYLTNINVASVWEASRFALRKMTSHDHGMNRARGIDIRTVLLFREMIRTARQNNIKYYEVVVDGLMKRVLKRVGWNFTILNIGLGNQGEKIFYGLLSCSDMQYEKISYFLSENRFAVDEENHQ